MNDLWPNGALVVWWHLTCLDEKIFQIFFEIQNDNEQGRSTRGTGGPDNPGNHKWLYVCSSEILYGSGPIASPGRSTRSFMKSVDY